MMGWLVSGRRGSRSPGLRQAFGLLLALLILTGCGGGGAGAGRAGETGTVAGAPESPPAGGQMETAGEPAASPAPHPEADQAGDPALEPFVDPAAFEGLGQLAFVWDGRLYWLDGSGTGPLRKLPGPGNVAEPLWSPDGRWLAYRRAGQAPGTAGYIGVVNRDGRRRYEYPDRTGGAMTWLPGSDILVVAGAEREGGPWQVRPGGEATPFAVAGQPVFPGAWSPDGEEVAYTATLPDENPEARSDALYTLPVAGGEPQQRFVAEQAGIRLLGWQPDGRSVLFWVNPHHSASIAADGLTLYALPASSGAPVPLTTTLLHREWFSWSPDGGRLLLVQGGGREAWRGKELAICEPAAGSCRALPQPPEQVSLDPAWSPTGEQVALVRAAALAEPPADAGELAAWVESRTLWLAAPDGTAAREITAAGRGVYSPRWSWDGQTILYVREGGIWAYSVEDDAAVLVASPPPAATEEPFGYYGHRSFRRLMDWYQPAD